MNTEHIHAEELDLAIPDMDSETAELAVKTSLQNLPGIIRVLLVGRGAFAHYDPNAINKDQICSAIRQAGYRASVFQDSKTGQTGLSSQRHSASLHRSGIAAAS
jgi:copper chaperone CopZ